MNFDEEVRTRCNLEYIRPRQTRETRENKLIKGAIPRYIDTPDTKLYRHSEEKGDATPDCENFIRVRDEEKKKSFANLRENDQTLPSVTIENLFCQIRRSQGTKIRSEIKI